MKPLPQWSVRRMFLWVFVAALICSHASRLYQTTFIGLDDFTISYTELREWISKLDSSAHAFDRSSGSGRSGDEVDAEFDCLFSTDTASAKQVLSHLEESVRRKASAGGWKIKENGESSGGFEFLLSKGVSRFRVYCWTIEMGSSSHEDELERNAKNTFRVIMLQVGYTQR